MTPGNPITLSSVIGGFFNYANNSINSWSDSVGITIPMSTYYAQVQASDTPMITSADNNSTDTQTSASADLKQFLQNAGFSSGFVSGGLATVGILSLLGSAAATYDLNPEVATPLATFGYDCLTASAIFGGVQTAANTGAYIISPNDPDVQSNFIKSLWDTGFEFGLKPFQALKPVEFINNYMDVNSADEFINELMPGY
jgi:hypothetical protein